MAYLGKFGLLQLILHSLVTFTAVFFVWSDGFPMDLFLFFLFVCLIAGHGRRGEG